MLDTSFADVLIFGMEIFMYAFLPLTILFLPILVITLNGNQHRVGRRRSKRGASPESSTEVNNEPDGTPGKS
jgi:hypothetical protein